MKLQDLIPGEIPTLKPIYPSLISILRAHSEINLSNLLAYFFKGIYEPNLQELFLTALIDSIDIEDSVFLDRMVDRQYKHVEVFTEYVTGGGGRIDILIVDYTKMESDRSAIIIENKLYHELNNDLDDYFYTVSNDFQILPKNIVVVLLSLKNQEVHHAKNMNINNVLHKTLGNEIRATLKTNTLDDKHSITLVEEYDKHIDDLYLESFSYGNEVCFEYYFKNRHNINALVSKYSGRTAEGNISSEESNLFVFHNTIQSAIREYYDHYVKITDRNVQGKDYFRGRGLSRDLIRYKLDFDDYFKSSTGIKLTVDMEFTKMRTYGIDTNHPELRMILAAQSITLPIDNKEGWNTIKENVLQIERPQLNLFFKQKIDAQWEALEIYIINRVKAHMIDSFNQNVMLALKARNATLEAKIIDGQVHFSQDFNTPFIRYSVRLFPPDLVEIILYVNADIWDQASDNMGERPSFIKFTDKQSYTIDGIKDESSVGRNEYFDALYKKSYRIAILQADSFLTIDEVKLWFSLEQDILYTIDPLLAEKIEDVEEDQDENE